MPDKQITNYNHFLVLPLKFVGCWDWYQKPTKEYHLIINNIYLCLVLFVLTNVPIGLMVYLHREWTDIMGSLDKLADVLPVLVSIFIVSYYAIYKQELYELMEFMNKNFVFHSARGLTNMTMRQSYTKAKKFAYYYTACTLFSVSMYVIMPVIVDLWMKQQQIQEWMYTGVTRKPLFLVVFVQHAVAQAFVGLAVGQLGVLFAVNAILLCGQLDILCCSLRNARYTALLQHGVPHSVLALAFNDILKDEQHQYLYSDSQMVDSEFHFDQRMLSRLTDKRTHFDIYSPELDEATSSALRECARLCRVVAAYKKRFERFVSPLLVLRVVQVTLYLCTLLYAATEKFDMMTIEYLGAVALDMFVYCYFGNQIILQADRVSTAAYQSAWHTMGPKPRRLLLNVLLANRRPLMVRAGAFLPMDLHTFLGIIKTSFSYYTLLVNVNDKKH